jgi:hypothetical protein
VAQRHDLAERPQLARGRVVGDDLPSTIASANPSPSARSTATSGNRPDISSRRVNSSSPVGGAVSIKLAAPSGGISVTSLT